MSEQTKATEMTREDFMALEHQIQVGAVETLPDGRSVKEAQADLKQLQIEQDAAIAEKGAKWVEKAAKKNGGDYLLEKVQVRVAENGAISARPESETAVAATGNASTSDSKTPASDIPADFPGREALIAGGVVLLENVGNLDKEHLMTIKGIGEPTAEKILAYGKAE